MQPEQKTSWLMRLRESAKVRREQRLYREPQPPWILRLCPESLHKVTDVVFLLLGSFASCLFALIVLWGFISWPMMYAQNHPNVPLGIWMGRYLHWLQAHVSKDHFGPVYCVIQVCVAFTLIYFMRVLFWIDKRKRDEKRQQQKSNVA
jgi:TRAP-type C4-dicarboxylate transport system permease small subunit